MNEKISPSAAISARKLLADVKTLNEGVNYEVNEESGVDELVAAVDGIIGHIKSNASKYSSREQIPILKASKRKQ